MNQFCQEERDAFSVIISSFINSTDEYTDILCKCILNNDAYKMMKSLCERGVDVISLSQCTKIKLLKRLEEGRYSKDERKKIFAYLLDSFKFNENKMPDLRLAISRLEAIEASIFA